MSDPQQQQPPSQQPVVIEALPWFVRIFSSPALLANVIAFGPALILMYTVVYEWPRQADRFYQSLQDQRDASRELQAMARENQRLLMRIEQLEGQQQLQLQGLQKVLTEMWFKLIAMEKERKGKEEEQPPLPP